MTACHEADHWWFRARRDLFLRQVARAAREAEDRSTRLRLLDYGCGTGFNLVPLAAFGDVWGADVPSEAGTAFRRASQRPVLDLSSDLSDHHQSFDVVTALDVLEHMDDDRQGLAAIARFVRPQGQIVLTVPAYRWLWGDEDVLSGHKRRYTLSGLVAVCRDAGLVVRFASYFNLTVLPAALLAILSSRLRPAGSPVSNLERTPGWLGPWLYRLASFEARRVGEERWRPPTGASLVCRCALGGAPLQ